MEDRKDVNKEVVGDKAIKATKDIQFPYDIFTMTNGENFINKIRRETVL
jgi:hypothetical protein